MYPGQVVLGDDVTDPNSQPLAHGTTRMTGSSALSQHLIRHLTFDT